MRTNQRRTGAVAVAASLVLLISACTTGGADEPGGGGGAGPTGELPEEVVLLGGTQELTVTGVGPEIPVTLLGDDDAPILTLISDEAGQAHFAYVPDEHLTVETGGENVIPTTAGESLKPGTYRVAVGEGDDAPRSGPIEVRAIDDHPDPELYTSQELTGLEIGILGQLAEGVETDDGFQYLEMRDGTRLSAMVRFPDRTLYGDGPWPTVVEYSGYDPISNPDGEEPGLRIARALGYATVGVSMRGTGCSGGAFDVFSPAQQADGYDIIETVAAQPWVKGNRVGMVGLSYSGITQLYAAATRPPSLAAITPQSVIVDPWVQQWPGGVYNGGFTKQWLAERDRQATSDGMDWVSARVSDGDDTCAANLELRSQNIDFESFGRSLEFRPPDAGERDLRELVRDIEVPVFLTGAFQDEQTGPLFANMVDHFDRAPILRAGLWNGRHPDGYSPMNIVAWFEFLELYVDGEVPTMIPVVRDGLTSELAKAFGLSGATLPPDRLAEQFGDDHAAALAFYEAEQPIRVVFENGAGTSEAGAPGGRFEARFDRWPTPDATPRTWYLGPEGSLTDTAPTAADGEDTYRHDPEAGAEDFFGAEGYQLFERLWDLDWTEFPDGRSLSYLSEPLSEDLVLGGPGLVTLHFGSEAADADVQVSISEVRPDGIEYLLQSTWLRIGHRAEDPERSDGLRVEHLSTEEAYAPIPAGELVEARLGMAPVAAALRAGSRLRVQIATPGRNHGTWLFEGPEAIGEGDEPTHRVGRSATAPSAITLSILDGIDVAPGLPPCPALRGQPCRTFSG